jgi:hypothetical protein
MKSKSHRVALLSTLALLVCGLSASAASASMQFEWKVNGTTLAAKASKSYVAKDKGAAVFHLQMSVAGITMEVTSSKMKVASGASFNGGRPGAGEEFIELDNAQVAKPANCSVQEVNNGPYHGRAEIISTALLTSEIVEGAIERTGNGKVDLLFKPKSGTGVTQFEITGGSCVLKGTVVTITGSVLAEAAPQKAEATTSGLLFEAKTKEYKTAAGSFAKAGLLFVGGPATLTGEAETELVSHEAFGAF